MSEPYIKSHFSDIKSFANVIEARVDNEWLTLEAVLEENGRMLEQCRRHKVVPVWIDENYSVDLEL